MQYTMLLKGASPMANRIATAKDTVDRTPDAVATRGHDSVRTIALWSHIILLFAAILSGCAMQVEPGSESEDNETSGAGSAGAAGAVGAAWDGVGATGAGTGGAWDSAVAAAGAGSALNGAGGTPTGTGGTVGVAGMPAVMPLVPDPGEATGGNSAVGAPGQPADVVNSFVCPGGSIVPGFNTLMVNGRARTFVADFPADPTRPMGILFSWHGYNQAEGQHHDASNLNPNGNPDLPVVVITPDDLDFELPVGLDWQLDEGSVATNVDLQFFEAMVGCLNEQYDIDPARIHSLGYSAGSVMTALLHSVYPTIVRSVICISGMWFNDQAEIDAIIFAGLVLSPTWPPLRPEDAGTILLTHGGLTDIAAVIINLETMAQRAFPFLAQANRVVVDCAHNNGHTGSPDVGADVISRFISENPSDRPSPYLSGGYVGWPGSCALRLP